MKRRDVTQRVAQGIVIYRHHVVIALMTQRVSQGIVIIDIVL